MSLFSVFCTNSTTFKTQILHFEQALQHQWYVSVKWMNNDLVIEWSREGSQSPNSTNRNSWFERERVTAFLLQSYQPLNRYDCISYCSCGLIYQEFGSYSSNRKQDYATKPFCYSNLNNSIGDEWIWPQNLPEQAALNNSTWTCRKPWHDHLGYWNDWMTTN